MATQQRHRLRFRDVFTVAQLEAYVLDTIEHVLARSLVEDSVVELKTQWPVDHLKAARQIAALANAARADHALWIIGVDENAATITGADKQELANWWPAVAKHFDGLAPELLVDRMVPTQQGPLVVALLFGTEARPYVVTTGSTGPVTHEVPWREGKRTRSAKHADLVRLLVPIATQPHVEIMAASAWIHEAVTSTDGTSSAPTVRMGGRFTVTCYIVPRSPLPLVIPYHHNRAEAVVGPERYRVERLYFQQRIAGLRSVMEERSPGSVEITSSEVTLHGPGKVTAEGSFGDVPEADIAIADRIEVELRLEPVDTSAAVIRIPMVRKAQPDKPTEARFEWPGATIDESGL